MQTFKYRKGLWWKNRWEKGRFWLLEEWTQGWQKFALCKFIISVCGNNFVKILLHQVYKLNNYLFNIGMKSISYPLIEWSNKKVMEMTYLEITTIPFIFSRSRVKYRLFLFKRKCIFSRINGNTLSFPFFSKKSV